MIRKVLNLPDVEPVTDAVVVGVLLLGVDVVLVVDCLSLAFVVLAFVAVLDVSGGLVLEPLPVKHFQ